MNEQVSRKKKEENRLLVIPYFDKTDEKSTNRILAPLAANDVISTVSINDILIVRSQNAIAPIGSQDLS